MDEIIEVTLMRVEWSGCGRESIRLMGGGSKGKISLICADLILDLRDQ